MNCANRDQDLLFHVHGELPLLSRMVLDRHLSRCSACRERHAQLMAASRQIASAIRGPQMPPWRAPGKSAAAVKRRAMTLGLVAVLMIASAIAVAVAVHRVSNVTDKCQTPQVNVQTAPSTPCRPGLPSDRCQ